MNEYARHVVIDRTKLEPVAKYPPVPVADVPAGWARVRPFLEPGFAEYKDEWTEGDILLGLLSGKFILFAGMKAAVVYAQNMPVLQSVIPGGDLAELKEMEADICAQAKRLGFKQMRWSGRRAWLRLLSGYRELYATAVKDL